MNTARSDGNIHIFLAQAAHTIATYQFFRCVGGTMDTMETIEVASGLSTEVKMLVAVCVVLATMLVLTMVSAQSRGLSLIHI